MILDGKATSLAIQNELAEAVQRRVLDGKRPPHLAAILVGNHPASRAYVGHKVKACERIGFRSTLHFTKVVAGRKHWTLGSKNDSTCIRATYVIKCSCQCKQHIER